MNEANPVLAEILNGDVLSLPAAAKQLPSPRGAGRANPSTVWRWITTGSRAGGRTVKLEAARLGSSWFTSRAAIARFMESLTPGATTPAAPRAPTKAARRRAGEAAAKRLQAAGA